MTIESTSPSPRSVEGAGRIELPSAPEELQSALAEGRPVAWSEPLSILTYPAAEPSVYPMYLDHRVYQGSSGKVYPLPFTEAVSDTAEPREWQAVHLENRFLRLVVLPELGGRIHIGYDKTTDYDFFYRNNVIKPALVGLAGPWVSGGVEFNWPQHHRPATVLPVEHSIEYGPDGSVTVWCADHDPFARMAGQHGVRLRPDSSVVEVVVRLHNRTSERQSFLWWANVAARVHDDYQSFFPEDVRYVADHARRAITAFPRADRPYYGVDYPALADEQPGADRIDFYRNIPVPTSYMVVDSRQDFFGGYDHAENAGFVHWAERRLSPGKKQWTWGDADFGRAWDAQLTDADGPYVELMAGVYTDNQPDFSWLLPGETKVFSQFWFPIPGIGAAHQATPDAAVHVRRGARCEARVATTAPRRAAVLRVRNGETPVASRTVDLSPGRVESIGFESVEPSTVVELLSAEGTVLVRWTAPVAHSGGEPSTAEEPSAPEQIDTVEELYLTGLHLSQYRHPTRSPRSYWHEALRRDPGDIRTNLAIGDGEYRSGRYGSALAHAELALERLTRRNGNPLDTEAYYLAGLALRRLGRDVEAEEHFGKAGWDGTWAAAAGFELAASLLRRGRHRAAERVLDTLDGVVGHDSRRAVLRAIVLRAAGRPDEAGDLLRAELALEPLNPTVRVLSGHSYPSDPGLLLDVAFELRTAGAADEALAVLERLVDAPVTAAGNVVPVAHYVAAGLLDLLGRAEEAAERRRRARASDTSWAFPFGLDAHDALTQSLAVEPDDVTAHSLLGMLLYAHGRRHEALDCWERAIAHGGDDPVLLRNAGLAAYSVAHDDELAWKRYGRAIERAPQDARLRYEHDQLSERLGHAASVRLSRLDGVRDLVLSRDDFTVVYVELLAAEGRASEAYEILTTRSFHPWEGGEGRALRAWDDVREALGLVPEDPPATLGEARSRFTAPRAVGDDGVTDYFATSLPEMLLFSREAEE